MSTNKSDDLLEFKTLDCLDRIVITGTSRDFGWESAMRKYCFDRDIDKNYLAAWARPHTDSIKLWAEEAACACEEPMVDCNRYKDRKDDLVKKAIEKYRPQFGQPIVVFKSMENCHAFYRSQSQSKAYLKGGTFGLRANKCLHYYVYFLDHILGLVCLRIQSYAPFSIQFIINGHHILENLLTANQVKYTKRDNCFTHIDNHKKAQELSNQITGPFIARQLERITKEWIPVLSLMPNGYRFTVRQIEHSTDIYTPDTSEGIDKVRKTILQLCLQRPDDFMVYITEHKGRRNQPEFSYRETHLGICAKFHAGTTSIKTYHKFDSILRVETSCYNTRKIRMKRVVHSKNGENTIVNAQLTRSLEDIGLFIDYGKHANNRMRQRLAQLWTRSYSHRKLQQVAQRTHNQKINFSGINFFAPKDESILQAAGSPQHDLAGFKRSDIALDTGMTPTQAGYAIRRLKAHKLIKKINGTHRYFLTKQGRAAIITSKTLQNLVATPIMAA
jgi:hypothetical protein